MASTKNSKTVADLKSIPWTRKESSDENNVINIQAFCDGMGLNNPLATASTSHNSTMFFFVILDLPPSYYADFSHIHLIAMCNSNELKTENGLHTLLSAIVEDLSDLKTKCFEIYIPSNGMRRVLLFSVNSQETIWGESQTKWSGYCREIHIKGIKKFCLWNRLKFFHILEN